jgi:xanthine dehydrogenase accessory factor
MNVPPTASVFGPPNLLAASGEGAQWLKPLTCWVQALIAMLQYEPVVVRIVLATVRGSAPREPGAGMLVSSSGIEGTIGGGQLEWDALVAARALLDDGAAPARIERIVLGTDRGQCCGGVVEVWMERYTCGDIRLLEAGSLAAQRGATVLMSTIRHTAVERRIGCHTGIDIEVSQLLQAPYARAAPRIRRNENGEVTLFERLDDVLPPLWIYGAGHVGQALARIVSELPLRLTWIDSRAGQFPARIPAAIQVVHSPDPVQSVAAAPAGARFLVMTHSHSVDYALCRAILARNDFAWAGLIGSKSKAARFRSRLASDGFDRGAIARLVCPVGIGGIASKWPAAIAVGVAAQVMRDISAQAGTDDENLTFNVLPAKAAYAGYLGEGRAVEGVACAPVACAACGLLAAQTGKGTRRHD